MANDIPEPAIFFRPIRYAQSLEISGDRTIVRRRIETVPGRMAREYAASAGSSSCRDFVHLLTTALTPKDWVDAVELCWMCEDWEAVEYALGKLATLQDCTWWCCVNAMLRFEFLKEECSPQQRALIERGQMLVGHWREQMVVAEALSIVRAPVWEIERAIAQARDADDYHREMEISVRRDFILRRDVPRGLVRIVLHYPFLGPAIL